MKPVPNCEKCIFYKPGPYTRTGVCTRYVAYRGRGKMVYEFSDTVRLDKFKCGPEGKMFISDPREYKKHNGEILWSLLTEDE
jgi:hypothetical protein